MFRLVLPMTIALLVSAIVDAEEVHKQKRKPNGIFNTKNMPSTGEQWQTSADGSLEYQPAPNLSPLAKEHLRRLTGNNQRNLGESSNGFEKIYVDGIEKNYDSYAQAWRALGFYIDCDSCMDEDGYIQADSNCIINDGNGDQDQDQDNEDDALRGGCQRFLLWAAYVDEDYSGGGIHEYAYYDRNTGSYSYKACKQRPDDDNDEDEDEDEDDRGRCVKMNCHEPTTHYSLLGFFKEPYYDQWMEQLFKHEGDCLWSDDEYNFMQKNREYWPTGCTLSNTEGTLHTGKTGYLYYDLKPMPYGEMDIGLYTDARCIKEYHGSLTAEEVLENAVCTGYVDGGDDVKGMCGWFRGNGDDNYGHSNVWKLDEQLSAWNAAFDIFKTCQPCNTGDISQIISNQDYNATGDRQKWKDTHPDDEDDEFYCNDDAGYQDVNQCMKFATHTTLVTASWRDVELAGVQGTITTVSMPSHSGNQNDKAYSHKKVFGKSVQDKKKDKRRMVWSWIIFGISVAFVIYGQVVLKKARNAYSGSSMSEPLVPSATGVVS